MKTAILVHGMPSEESYIANGRSASTKHWFPWLKEELTKVGITTYAPEMPEPYSPVYEKWAATFEQLPLGKKTMLVGHSCGGGFLVRWLSENKVEVDRVILAAPWMDPNRQLKTGFFDFAIDEDLASRTKDISLSISLDDDQEELTTRDMLKVEIKGLRVREFTNKGHFLFKEFPELKEELLK